MSGDTTAKCQNCGATLPRTRSRCWLCGHDTANAPLLHFDDENPYASPVAVEAENPHGFSLASLMLFVTLVSVVLGISSIWPGVGIALGVFVVIPFLRTALLVKARAVRGRATPWGQRFALAALSGTVVLAMTMILGVAFVAAFFVACVTAGYLGQVPPRDDFSQFIFFGILIAAAIGVLIGFGYWARYRWRRDVETK